MYYLMDLERSVLSGKTTYWRPNGRGYTNDLKQAGLYREEMAMEIAETDYNNRTVLIHESVVEGLTR